MAQRNEKSDESIKETIESIVIAFILAFVFRAYVVEAFVIPTGSMAPTLLGQHIHVVCDQCGYPFNFDPPDYALQETVRGMTVTRGYITVPDRGRREPLPAVCPMCHYPNVVPRGTPLGSGDRILVHKYIYSFSEPRRWDVVVFKAPHDPPTNFIKRLVGLPNERLYLFDGNIYVQPADPSGEPTGPWHVARKTNRPDVQRAVWQPIYHSNYIPLDRGDRIFPGGRFDWAVPWVAQNPQAWLIEGRRSYVYNGQGSGTLRFSFDRGDLSTSAAIHPYNAFKPRDALEPIEDVRIAAAVEPHAPGLTLELSTTARLDDRTPPYAVERLIATVHADGRVALEAADLETGRRRLLRKDQTDPLPAGAPTSVELWYADQGASIWIAGERVLRWTYDLPPDQLIQRPPPRMRPRIRLTVSGGAATLHNVQVDRDLYYSNRNPNVSQHPVARGALLRPNERPPLNRPTSRPLHLGPDEFFCVGDNSPRSYDGRFWIDVNPWVEKRMLDERIARGEPTPGIVPRDLMMGRAFFVYFPAPYSLGYLPLPNFGDMRFIH